MRARYLIANWKMNLPPEGMEGYLSAVAAAERAGGEKQDTRDNAPLATSRSPLAMQRGEVNVVIAPPFPYLAAAKPHEVAGQNCGDQKSGAFTGEVSVSMLADCGARFVIIGHSERRNVYGESDAMIARKLALAIEAGLTPVLCVGEDLACRDAGNAAGFLAGQIEAVAVEQLATGRDVIVAYEPIWAIGTGRNASGAMCAETVAEVRAAIGRFWPAGYEARTAVLYGGSVTPENIADLETNGGADGYLVGGASLSSAKFLALLAGMNG